VLEDDTRAGLPFAIFRRMGTSNDSFRRAFAQA